MPNCPWATNSSTEIAREIDKKGTRLLVLDEPTACAHRSEADILLDSMRRLAAQGISSSSISHRLQEVMSVCDDIVILRDGEVVLQTTPAETSVRQIASAMVGRKIDRSEGVEEARELSGKVVMDIEHLWVDMPGETVRDVNLTVFEGEFSASAAWPVRASSASPTASWACIPQEKGHLSRQKRGAQQSRLAAFHGHFAESEDRRGVGLLLEESIAWNIIFTSLQTQKRFSRTSAR